jgi:hypothetical protein
MEAWVHSPCEWGRATTKTLQAGLIDFCFFLPIPPARDIRAHPSYPWLVSFGPRSTCGLLINSVNFV